MRALLSGDALNPSNPEEMRSLAKKALEDGEIEWSALKDICSHLSKSYFAPTPLLTQVKLPAVLCNSIQSLFLFLSLSFTHPSTSSPPTLCSADLPG
jgi:hypothetical protein